MTPQIHASQPGSMPELFAALADPVRLAIVERLLDEGEISAGALAEPFAISKPAISRHIAVLEKAGMVERRVKKQFRLFRIRPQAMRDLDQWVRRYRHFWETSFDRLERLFPQSERGATDNKGDSSNDNSNA
ncbi:helix-turn-helix transcriptional regulator [Stappia sp. F7233]|uniref:Helix-turn-helix transcriptional regulator n=1 Tax=Stappia albiluteola TaxID=2758565 RepID=A0A839AG60_9HYPH|nr:metalloregulator ArsR/SmtB family transcription factor [Stappia albiluteola]MBA5777852.1 helix-turn-helix transcriptional regulator [Stappia albiluteola]